ncbi:alpha-glucosidase C-terminal domain-containing protein, partial [candidate division KSB1 bacterium]|nr:alpha-glucosidase C-terminal domain-containing protein [candidate division KSB1 bacterium]
AYGEYSYPASILPNSADIQAVHADFTENYDSLNIKIELERLSDNTRIGFYILNSLEGNLTEAMDDVDINMPAWEGHGVFVSLADPTSEIFRTLYDNKFLVKKGSTSEFIPITFDVSKLIFHELDFTVAINDLEKVLGTFNRDWYFIAYSYFVTLSGSYELEREQGASGAIEDPDIFDLAFCGGWNSQPLLLRNYILPNSIGGPRLAAIGSVDRGAVGLSGTDIDENYTSAPYLTLFARGGDLYRSSVDVAGRIESDDIAVVTLHVNDKSYDVDVVDRLFELTVELNEGSNVIYASAVYDDDKVTTSMPIKYNYLFDKTPVVLIQADVRDHLVTLDGSGSFSPEDRNLRYSWRQDEANPQQIEFSSRNSAVVTFDAPSTPGEYYFTLVATAGSNSGWARSVIVVNDSAHTVDYDTWHPAWVDSMILYEIFVRTYDVTGKLNAVKSDLYSLKQQGINCIWFMPVHPSPSTHGYWITDYFDINPEYGTINDFQTLVQEAHKYGIKIIMDLVINHTGDTHPFMLDALENGNYSPYRDFYSWNPNGSFQYLYSWVNLPSINYSEQWVRDYLIYMSKWWVQKYNIDGFRCDVAHAIEEGRSEGPAFWQRWRRELKQMKPDIFLLAEAAASNPTYFNKKFDSAYDYWLYGTVKNALSNTANADDLRQIMQHHKTAIPPSARPMRYIENHDESRFFEGFSKPQTKIASAIDFTLPGIPLIYAGQEVGELTSRGVIDWGDPDDFKAYYDMLIDLRRSNHALNFGTYINVPSDNNKVFSFLRKSDQQVALVVVNLSSSTQEVSLDIPIGELPYESYASIFLNDLVYHQTTPVTVSELANYSYEIKPYLFTVLEISDVATRVGSNDTSPHRYHLYDNYPNPFNSSTVINFSIGGYSAAMTHIEVYNVLGQRICTLVDQRMVPGEYSVVWDGNDEAGNAVGTGLYLCRIKSADYVRSIKMLVLK